MTVRVLEGHVLDVLRSLPSDTFQCVTTSPPYYGLRDYGLPPQVWGGEAEHEHAWRTANTRKYGNLNEGFNHRWNPNWAEGGKQDHARPREVSTGAFCPCGAWLGSLGLEPTPELYVEHLVSVFREVRRVLRPDGCIFVNLGDSYAGSGKGPNTGNSLANGRGDSVPQEVRQGFVGVKVDTPPGCKPKDLLGMPWMVAFALRADGWYLRAEIIWSKPNPMPESVTDRPTKAHETVFLLSKQRTYFYDADAIREKAVVPFDAEYVSPRKDWRDIGGRRAREVSGRLESGTVQNTAPQAPEAGRNKRSVWEIATAPFPNAHFATWPPKLVEPMLLAGSRPGDHVLDPFGGAGTTGLVADRLGRDCTLIELNPEYAQMARDRITGDSPLFAGVVA